MKAIKPPKAPNPTRDRRDPIDDLFYQTYELKGWLVHKPRNSRCVKRPPKPHFDMLFSPGTGFTDSYGTTYVVGPRGNLVRVGEKADKKPDLKRKKQNGQAQQTQAASEAIQSGAAPR